MLHYAHSLQERPLNEWQLLEDHLHRTADLRKRLANVGSRPARGAWLRTTWTLLTNYRVPENPRLSDLELLRLYTHLKNANHAPRQLSSPTRSAIYPDPPSVSP